jgi:hypothetical protein
VAFNGFYQMFLSYSQLTTHNSFFIAHSTQRLFLQPQPNQTDP